MNLLVILSIVAIVLLVGVLALFLFWIGKLLSNISNNLIASNDAVKEIIADAGHVKPGLEHINHTGGVVSGALPLLYGHAERIAGQKTPTSQEASRAPSGDSARRSTAAVPSAKRRRSRLMETVGYRPR